MATLNKKKSSPFKLYDFLNRILSQKYIFQSILYYPTRGPKITLVNPPLNKGHQPNTTAYETLLFNYHCTLLCALTSFYVLFYAVVCCCVLLLCPAVCYCVLLGPVLVPPVDRPPPLIKVGAEVASTIRFSTGTG